MREGEKDGGKIILHISSMDIRQIAVPLRFEWNKSRYITVLKNVLRYISVVENCRKLNNISNPRFTIRLYSSYTLFMHDYPACSTNQMRLFKRVYARSF